MNTVIFFETTLLYVPATVVIGVLFFKACMPAWRVRAHVFEQWTSIIFRAAFELGRLE